MMKLEITYKPVIVVFLLMIAVSGAAQQLPVEHIIFSADKEDYQQSDDIIIRGQVFSNDTLSVPYSRYLEMELWNSEDSLMVHHKLCCAADGRFVDKLQVPFDVPSGAYYLRAYTRLMRNYPLDTLPIETIYVGREKKAETAPDLTSYRCAFYPEGGHALQGVAQKMAVRVLSNDGKPVQVPYFVCDQKSDTICSDVTTHSGWQRFVINQQAGKRYYLCISNSVGELLRYELPAPENAPTITATANRKQVVYQIHATEAERKELSLYVYHPTLGLMLMPLTPEKGVMKLADLQEGMLSMLLVNRSNEIVSQTFHYVPGQ